MQPALTTLKIVATTTFLLSFVPFIKAQPGIIGDGFSNGWNNPTNIIYLSPSFGESYMVVLNPKAVGDQYFRLVSGTSEMSPSVTCAVDDDKEINNSSVAIHKIGSTNCSNGKWFIKTVRTTDNYVFKTTSSIADSFSVFRIGGTIQSVASVTQAPTNVSVGQDVVVTGTLSGAFATGQEAYLRYSRDGFATSTIVRMSDSGTSCTATIPASANTVGTIQYYIFTSGTNISISDSYKADHYTINRQTNNGNYFSYAIISGTTYTWNVSGNGDWNTPSNWIPSRTLKAPSDILIFNNGTTNNITNIASETIGGLQIIDSTIVNLQSSISSTLSITNGVVGNDLNVTTGSQLNLNGTSAFSLSLVNDANGNIVGNMDFSNANHRISATKSDAIIFDNGSTLTQNIGCGGHIFNDLPTNIVNTAIFKRGSQFIQKDGANPFALTQPKSKVVFQPGSWYRFQVSNGAIEPSFSGRTYSNFEYNISTSRTGTGNNLSVDTLLVSNGTLNINTSSCSVKGDIIIATGATLTFSPSSSGIVNLSGSTPQYINNSGTLTVGNNATMAVSPMSTIYLNSNITVNGSLRDSGNLHLSNNIVNGSGTFIMTLNSSVSTAHTSGLSGNLTLTGTKTFSTNNNFTYMGSSNQTEGLILPDTVGSITLSKSEGVVSFQKNLTIVNTLSFVSDNQGKIAMGDYRLLISNSGTAAINRVGKGYIIGKLLRNIAAGNHTYSFPVGTDLGYTPVSITLTSASGNGNILAQSITGRHAQVNNYGLHPTDYLNRWWQLTNSSLTFVSANISFNYLESDLVNAATANSLKLARHNGSAWSYPSVSTASQSIVASNITSLGDFTAGDCHSNTNIITQPSQQIIKAGQNTQFQVTATGLNLTYQWQKNGSNIENAIGNTLSISNATTADMGNYSVVVTGLCGSSTSHIANLSVIPAPTNDNVSSPTPLSQVLVANCNSLVSSTLYGANPSNVAIPTCNGQSFSNLDDIWFRFIPQTPNPTIIVEGNTDLMIQLLESNGTTSVICMNSNIGNNEILATTGLTAGSTYYIRILAVNTPVDASSGTLAICVSGEVSPSVSAGVTGSCYDVRSIFVGGDNSGEWIYMTDNSNHIVAAIKNENQNLGNISGKILVLSSTTLRTNDVLKFIDRDFEIVPTNNVGATVRLYFTDAEKTSIGVPLSEVKILRIAGGLCSTTADFAGSSEIIPITAGSNYVEFSTPGFSRFYVGVPASPLPIELQSFSGYTEGGINKLKWTTGQQLNTHYFVVERSADGQKKWSDVTPPITAEGTSQSVKEYYAIDEEPLINSYYRLKSVDFDKKIQHSAIINVQNMASKSSSITLSPNPVSDKLTIIGPFGIDNPTRLTIYDITGKVYEDYIIKTTAIEVSLAVQHLPKGIFLLKIENQQRRQVERFVKR